MRRARMYDDEGAIVVPDNEVSSRFKPGMLVLGCVAAGLATLAVVQWWSWYQLYGTEQYIKQLASTGWIEDEDAWRVNQQALQKLEALSPSEALVHWQLGELQYWHAAGLRLWPERQREVLEAARQHYFRAAARAPSDGVLLARIAYRLVETDEPFALALMRRAMDLALFEPPVQYHLAHVGLRFSEELDEAMKTSFQTMLEHALKNPKLAPRIRELIKRYDHSELLSRLPGIAVD